MMTQKPRFTSTLLWTLVFCFGLMASALAETFVTPRTSESPGTSENPRTSGKFEILETPEVHTETRWHFQTLKESKKDTVQEKNLPKLAEAMLKERDLQIKSLIGEKGTKLTDEQRAELKEIINNVIDYTYMARASLQETYEEITAEQRDEFTNLFASMIRDNSLANTDIYRADVTYDEFTMNENGTLNAATTAELENVRTTVGYLLEFRNEEWHILDMSVDGVSTVESYQRQFQSILRKRGFEPLLHSLRKRAERNQP